MTRSIWKETFKLSDKLFNKYKNNMLINSKTYEKYVLKKDPCLFTKLNIEQQNKLVLSLIESLNLLNYSFNNKNVKSLHDLTLAINLLKKKELKILYECTNVLLNSILNKTEVTTYILSKVEGGNLDILLFIRDFIRYRLD